MPTIRELEDLIIDAIYLDVIRGKLDQKEHQFDVEYTMGRDLEPGKIETLLHSLQNWCVLRDILQATAYSNASPQGRQQHLPYLQRWMSGLLPSPPRPHDPRPSRTPMISSSKPILRMSLTDTKNTRRAYGPLTSQARLV